VDGGATPVPVSVTSCGLPFALSGIEIVTGEVTLGIRSKRHVDRACCTGWKARSTRIGLGERECSSNSNNVELCRAGVAQRDGVPGTDSADKLIAERNTGD
jgi:hypothetical protein